MNTIFLGPPAAGKGTQAKRAQELFGLHPLSTGDLLRAAVAAGTPIGREAKAIMAEGKLVPDAIVTGLIAAELGHRGQGAGFILDGFPRTLAQAQALEPLLAEAGCRIDLVIGFEIDEAKLLGRILNRRDQAARQGHAPRADDTEAALHARLRDYYATIPALREFYRQRGLLVGVDASASEVEVGRAVEQALRPYAARG
jgi:adenylate kinase